MKPEAQAVIRCMRAGGVVGVVRRIRHRRSSGHWAVSSPDLLRGHVHQQNAVRAGVQGIAVEGRRPVCEDGVVVAENDDRDLRAQAQRCDHAQDSAEVGPGREGPGGGTLDHRAVCGRVRERHPQLQHVRPARHMAAMRASDCAVSGSPAVTNPTRAFSCLPLSCWKVASIRFMTLVPPSDRPQAGPRSQGPCRRGPRG